MTNEQIERLAANLPSDLMTLVLAQAEQAAGASEVSRDLTEAMRLLQILKNLANHPYFEQQPNLPKWADTVQDATEFLAIMNAKRG